MKTRRLDVIKNKSMFKKALSVLLAIVLVTSLNCYSYSWGDITGDDTAKTVSTQSTEEGTSTEPTSSLDPDATTDQLEKKVEQANTSEKVAGAPVPEATPITETEGIETPATGISTMSTSSEETTTEESTEGDNVEGSDGEEVAIVTASDDAEEETEGPSEDAEEISAFDTLKAQIEDPNGPAEIVLTETMVATSAINVNRAVKIFGADGISISRDSQTHSIFTVNANGNLTLSGVKLVSDESSKNNSSYWDKSPIVSNGTLLIKDSIVSGFVSYIGGGISVMAGTATLSKSVISNNHARGGNYDVACGGGVYLESNAVMQVLNGTIIESNMAHSSLDVGFEIGGAGGGIYAEEGSSLVVSNSTISNNRAGKEPVINAQSYAFGAGGGLFVGPDVSFTLSKSVVSGNSAFAWKNDGRTRFGGGGGIYIYSASNSTILESGLIKDNYAQNNGGGMYVHSGELILQNAAVVSNDTSAVTNNYSNPKSVGSNGGGVWYCETGEGKFYATNGCMIESNSAGSSAGADFFSTMCDPGNTKIVSLPTRTLSGEKYIWKNDGSSEYVSDQTRPITPNPDPMDDLKGFLDKYSAAEYNIGLKASASFNLSDYALIISNNNASIGAGIASNGSLTMGEDKDVTLTINKEWKDADGNALEEGSYPEEIRVNVFNNGNLIDTVTLNSDNNWETTLIDLPYNGNYTVEEETPEGYEVSYAYNNGDATSVVPTEAHGAYSATITNTPEAPEPEFGSLTINKTLTGNFQSVENGKETANLVGDVTAVFHVVGKATDESGAEVEIYNNYVGMNFSATGLAEQSVKLENLPLGTYTVEEVNYDGNGYQLVKSTETTLVLGTQDDQDGIDVEVSFENKTTSDTPSTGIVNRYTKIEEDSDNSESTDTAEKDIVFEMIRFFAGAQEQARTEEVA